MKKNDQKKSSLVQISVILLLICAIVYVLLRAVLIAMADCSTVEKIFGVMFFMAEFYVVIHAFGFFFGVYRLNLKNYQNPGRLSLKNFQKSPF
ncbi:MAG TPA: hypothetical protein PLP05_04660 [Sedimentisphaerales bacterium]|nr:hypothetical protein [Sedimentisphaerales bacterium]